MYNRNTLELRPSLRQTLILALPYGLALVFIARLNLLAHWHWATSVLVLVSGLWFLCRDGLLCLPTSLIRIQWVSPDEVHCMHKNGSQWPGKISAASRVLPWATLLVVQGQRTQRLLLTRWNCADQPLRDLNRALRFGPIDTPIKSPDLP